MEQAGAGVKWWLKSGGSRGLSCLDTQGQLGSRDLTCILASGCALSAHKSNYDWNNSWCMRKSQNLCTEPSKQWLCVYISPHQTLTSLLNKAVRFHIAVVNISWLRLLCLFLLPRWLLAALRCVSAPQSLRCAHQVSAPWQMDVGAAKCARRSLTRTAAPKGLVTTTKGWSVITATMWR